MRHSFRTAARRRDPQPPCPYHGGLPSLDAALARIESSAVYLAINRQKTFADNLMTGRLVHMEACRQVAMAEDVRGSLALCAEIRRGLGRPPFRTTDTELRGTEIALRWRRRFPKAKRIFRVRSPFFGGRG